MLSKNIFPGSQIDAYDENIIMKSLRGVLQAVFKDRIKAKKQEWRNF